MTIEAFIILEIKGEEKEHIRQRFFADHFLSSYDFDTETLKKINQKLGLSSEKKKDSLARKISDLAYDMTAQRVIIEYLTIRNRAWMAMKIGHIGQCPTCSDPAELVVSKGEEKWYGPIT